MNNCRRATFLTEKKIAGKITTIERIQLNFHLAACPLCRIYLQQSVLINEAFVSFQHTSFTLDDAFKKKLIEKIELEIKKNNFLL
ncbi:hypothetical protein [uncultured Pedobacter sp.]|uniref:hypothetical protein n=1 Tax=uncultured Pedobacter sp. TaxID=246139 RepID=UPI0025E0E0E0|nr:hypothetical protein [uncultured Pedobacter sp.]